MSPLDPETPTTEVAQRLREIRETRRISLRELARLSGMSVNALSQIERGITSPSVSTLYKLVEALGVPITAIFQAEPEREEIVFRTAAQRTQVPFPLGVWEGLGGESFVGRVQPFVLTLEGGGDSGSDPIVHTGHEFVLCLEGQLEYRIEGKNFFLEPGDSLLFAARLRHCWHNSGQAPVRAVIVLSGFEAYESPIGYHVAQNP
jgi:transcriptional regulator with XRE-family HTH domain